MSTVPARCHEDPRLLEQKMPSPSQAARIERAVASELARGHVDGVLGEAEHAVSLPLPELQATLPRPRFYPLANHSVQWFADNVSVVDFTFLRALVLHTTEVNAWPGYLGGGSAPNLTAWPDVANKRLVWRQHFGINQSGRSLVNAPGGVNTNTTNVLQVELIGTSAAGGPGLFWPNAPDWALLDLARFVRWLRDTWGVPAQSSVSWKAYPASYGASNGVRLSGAAWLAYRGILGHQHVPENDHGDPGLFPIQRLLAAVKTLDGGDDMSQADVDQIKAYIDKVMLGQGNVSSAVFSGTFGKDPDGTPRTAGELLTRAGTADAVLSYVDKATQRVLDRLAALEAKVDALTPPQPPA